MIDLTWVEISGEALTQNIKRLRSVIGDERILCACVKGNAYGHGLVQASRIFLEAGVDWLGVNSLYEAEVIRNADLKDGHGNPAPIYIMGYVALDDLEQAVKLGCRLVVYNRETIQKLGELGHPVNVHLKVETGNHRQGVLLNDLMPVAESIRTFKNINLEGLATHFANIEDTTDHSYAQQQLSVFNQAYEQLKAAGIAVPVRHCANSAATLLFEKTRFEMVRPGIACYGMWPSDETRISYQKEIGGDFDLQPALTWKTRVAQIKTIEPGALVGYGCTYRAQRPMQLAILPVGYYDGYDRGIRDGYVLIRGKRAPLCGRICMNIMMVDVTDIEGVALEDEVILLGQSGNEMISAEQLASWADTIQYEATTRINERIPRIIR